MDKNELRDYEIQLLLEAINFRYGYDFRNYARASLERRIENRVNQSNLKSISQMIPLVLHDEDFFDLFLKDMSITVTEMFRDPQVFKTIRETVCPHLHTYPRINIWHAGCATGEEVYSMAILLKEEGLLEKTRIYATDYNNHSLKIAEKGIYPLDKIRSFTENYLKSGGKSSFTDYYRTNNESAKLNEALKENIVFANHNLIKDNQFAQMHFILCRNALIYFDRKLQNRVLELFRDSLIPRGFIVLGKKETLRFTSVEKEFEIFEPKEKIFRRKLNV